MRAAILHEQNAPLTIEDIDIDDPAPMEARVRVVACGICHSDLNVIERSTRGPIVLGHEVAGVVEEVGSAVTSVQPGDRVIAAFVQPCGHCEFCESGKGNLCQQGSQTRDLAANPRLSQGGKPVAQMVGLGGWAEQILTPASGLVKVPDDVGLDVASLVGCGVMTGFGAATNTAKVEPGSTVAVIGTGGVGLNVIQGAKVAGARRIIAVDIAEHKLAYARRFGATDTIDASVGDPVEAVMEMTGGGVDYAFEAIGYAATARQAFDMLKRGGMAVIVGVIRDENIEIPGGALLMEKKLVGSLYGSSRIHKDMPRILALYKAGKIDLDGLITKRWPLEQINDGLDALRNGEVARSILEIGTE